MIVVGLLLFGWNYFLQTEVSIRTKAITAEKENLSVVTLKSIGDGVITCDTRGRTVLINPVAEKLSGWTQQEAAGLPLWCSRT